MQIVGQSDSQSLNQAQLPDSPQSKKEEMPATQLVTYLFNAWVDRTFRYSMKSRQVLLQSLNLKVHVRVNKIFVCLIFIVICLEQFIRTLATEMQDPQQIQSYYTLAQQALCAVALIFVQIYQPSPDKNSHIFTYLLELTIILLQPSFSPSTQQVLGANLTIQALLVLSYINLFSSFVEMTFVSMVLVVVNLRLRLQFYKAPNLLKCVKQHLNGPFISAVPQETQTQLVLCYEQQHWFDNIIYGAILFAVLCLHAHQFLRVESLQVKLYQNTQSQSEFDKPDIGVYDCQTIQGEIDVRNLMENMDFSVALFEFDRKQPNNQQKQINMKFCNQSFKQLLTGIDKDLKVACGKLAFQIFKFDNLPNSDINYINHINDSLSLDSARRSTGEETYSLKDIVTQIYYSENRQSTTLYLKLLQQKVPASDTYQDSDVNNSDYQTLFLKKEILRSNQFDRSFNSREKRLKGYLTDRERIESSEHLSYAQGFKIYEVKAKPIHLNQRLCICLQIISVNSVIQKTLNLAKTEMLTLPKFFTNEQSVQQLKQVIKYTQLVEQQISEFSGIPSRTSIIEKSQSSNSLADQPENIEGKVKSTNNWTNSVFARYQYYLSSVWCNAVHVANLQKSQMIAWHVQNKSLLLNFRKVSKQTQSIENHVKEFLIQFSQEIELKNLHVSVGQGQMPIEPLFTDWNLYDQILFQIVSNSVKYNKVNGAIAVSIYFQKEIKNAVKSSVLNSVGESSSPRSYEIGRMVTVVKDTGIGMSNSQQKQLFQIKTQIQNKTEQKVKGHILQPKVQGVGLTTAEILTKCLGGTIKVVSKEDCGTQVTFDIQVTTYPVKNRVPSYRYSDKGQTLTLPLKLQATNNDQFTSQLQSLRRENEGQNPKIPQKVETVTRESISDSESIQNEEELKIFEKVFKHFEEIENKSDGHLYHPKPPENSFFNQDYYLDDSFLQHQNLNEKSSHSHSHQSFRLQEEIKINYTQNQPKLVHEVISHQSTQQEIDEGQMQPNNSHSIELNLQRNSIPQGTVTTNRILSFADAMRSSISKRSPLTALVVSNTSLEYQRVPPTRTKSSEFKKMTTKTFNKRSENALQKQVRRFKAFDEALSCDDIKMKPANNSSKEIQIKSQEEKHLSEDRIIMDEQFGQKSKQGIIEVVQEEIILHSGSIQESFQQVSSQPKNQKSLRFPIVFSSGVASSNDNQQQIEIEDRVQQLGQQISQNPAVQMNQQRHQEAQQDFTFQRGRSSREASNSIDNMGRSKSSVVQELIDSESNQVLRSESIDQQVQISSEQDELRNKGLLQKLGRGSSAKNILRKQLGQVDEDEQQESFSDGQFTDPSIGESEHCFKIQEANGVVFLKESEKMRKLEDPQMEDRLKALNGLLSNKGCLNEGQQIQSSELDQVPSLPVQEPKKQTKSNSLKSSDDKQQLTQKTDQTMKESSDSLEQNLSNRLSKRRELAKNVDEKMKSQFSLLPSVKRIKESKPTLKRGLSSSQSSKMCKCKQVLVVTDDLEIQQLINETVSQFDANGIDVASDCAQAIKTLSLKLTAMCCTDSYELIFVTLEREFLLQKVTQSIMQTIDLWNEKLASKGKQPIQKPQIVAITSQHLKKSQKEGVDTVLQMPITSKQISDIFIRIGSYLL